MLIDLVFAMILTQLRGERVIVLLFDCSSAGYCAKVAAGLPKLLTECGICSLCACVYFWNLHGKSWCDAMFGKYRKKLLSLNIFSVD